MNGDFHIECFETLVEEHSQEIDDIVEGSLTELTLDLDNGCYIQIVREDDDEVLLELIGESDDMHQPELEDEGGPIAILVENDCDLSGEILEFIYKCMN